MIIYIFGEDTYRSLEYFQKLKRSFQEKYNSHGLNVHEYNGNEFNMANLRQAIMGGGLFHEKNLVCLRNVFAKCKDRKLRKDLEIILDKVEQSKDTIIILMEEGVPKDALAKKFGALKQSKQFKILAKSEQQAWARQYLQRRDKFIQPNALSYLVEMVDNNLWTLANELEKLAHYSKNNNITIDKVKKMTPRSFEENIFAFTDALMRRQKDRAIYILEEQWKSNVPPLLVLGNIIWQFRNIMSAKIGIAEDIHLHPFVLKKALSAANAFDMKKLQEIYTLLESMDRNFKSGRGDPKAHLSLFVMKVCR